MEFTNAQMTANDLAKTQGTRLQDLPPWMTYATEMSETLDPKLEEEIKKYSETSHQKTSAQNDEEFHRQKEINDEIGKQYQWIHPSEYADAGARIGKILTHAEIINILRKGGLKCWYVEHPHPDKLTLLVSDYWATEMPRVACWVTYGYCPEYSIMNFDSHGVPLAERYRGWRTVILQLRLQGLLSEERAKKLFGEAVGPASDRFNMLMYGMRNREER